MSEFERKVSRNVSENRRRAVAQILLKVLYASLAMVAFIGLERIGFISWEFMLILISLAALWAAFVAGQISTEIKF